MAKDSKSPFNTTSLLLFIGVCVFIFKLLNDNEKTTKQAIPLFITILIAGFVLVFTFQREKRKRKEKRIKEAFRADSKCFLLTIEPHLEVLSRKRSFLITEDDYGFVDRSKWEAEKNNFLKIINYQRLVTKDFSGLNDSSLLRYIEYSVDKYKNNNKELIKFSNSFTPYEYEQFCSYVLNQHGWEARTTRGSGDQGVDVIAKKGSLVVAIQCKKYSSPVGNSAVQEVKSGMHYWGANIAVVVTNTTYTKSARELAKSVNVILLHHEELVRLESILIKSK